MKKISLLLVCSVLLPILNACNGDDNNDNNVPVYPVVNSAEAYVGNYSMTSACWEGNFPNPQLVEITSPGINSLTLPVGFGCNGHITASVTVIGNSIVPTSVTGVDDCSVSWTVEVSGILTGNDLSLSYTYRPEGGAVFACNFHGLRV